MRAIVVSEAGLEPALTELPPPQPGPGEVLVRVTASSLNGFDAATVSGMLAGIMEHRYPVVPGMDYAGTVEAVGDGATRFRTGDPVLGVALRPYVGDGAFCELLAVSDQYAITNVPEGLDVATAGALGLAGSAAVTALAALDPQPGQTLLICGATGGVGSIATQYAVAAGATVVATGRPGAEADMVRDLGASHVVNYSGDLVEQVRAIAPGGVDAAVHLAGEMDTVVGLCAPGGRVASTLVFGPDHDPAVIPIVADPSPATLDRLAADIVAGRLQLPISRSYALQDVPKALTDFTAGTLGKFAVRVS